MEKYFSILYIYNENFISRFRKNFLFLIILFINILSYSQHKIYFINSNNEPIEYATIYHYCDDHKKTYFSNDSGIIVLKNTNCDSNILIFNSINYERKIIYFSSDNVPEKILIENKINLLKEVSITGQISENNPEKSIHKLQIYDNKDIINSASVDLAEFLDKKSSFKISRDNTLGTSINIQGLSGQNIKILIDGVEVIGRLNGNIDLSQLNLSNIERIEIIEGPLSVYYGSNAIAGTINLITKSINNKLRLNSDFYYESIGKYNLNFNLGKGLKKNNFIDFYLSRNFFDGHSNDPNKKRVMEWKPKIDFNSEINYKKYFKKLQLKINLKYYYEKLLSRGEPLVPYNETAFDSYFYTKKYNMNIHLDYKINNFFQAKKTLSFNNYSRIKQTYLKDLTTIEYTKLLGENYSDTSTISQITDRIDFYYHKIKKLKLNFGYDYNVELSISKRIEENQKRIHAYAAFLSAEYDIIKRIKLNTGIRYTYNSKYSNSISPSINIKFNMFNNVHLRASYGRGFRTPSVKELYFYFVDINHFIIGNNQLIPEKSNSYNISLRYIKSYNKFNTNLNISIYYNKLYDMISLIPKEISSNIYTYRNIDIFYTKGGNIEFDLFNKTFDAKISSGITGKYNSISASNNEINKFYFSPDVALAFTYKIEKYNIKFNVNSEYTGSSLNYYITQNNNIEQYKTKSYTMFDLSIYKNFYKNISIQIGSKNILNIKEINNISTNTGVHSGTNASFSYGRTFFLKILYKIEK